MRYILVLILISVFVNSSPIGIDFNTKFSLLDKANNLKEKKEILKALSWDLEKQISIISSKGIDKADIPLLTHYNGIKLMTDLILSKDFQPYKCSIYKLEQCSDQDCEHTPSYSKVNLKILSYFCPVEK